MEKAGTKRRDIHFRSDKNGIVVCVHSREAREYARYLEAAADVASYEAGTVLDSDKYPFINTIGIRKEYFDTQWTSDFVIHFTDGRTGIRELTNKDGLSKRAAIEKLEFSRRYWSTTKVAEWKIVVMEKGEC